MLIFLFLRNYYYIDTSQNSVLLPDYGFLKNGTFNVTFTNIETYSLYYALLPESMFPLTTELTNHVKYFCKKGNSHPVIHTLIPLVENFTFSGIIAEESVYTPLVYNCGKNSTIVNIDQIFRNPDSFLDYRWINAEYSEIFLLCVSFLLCLYWFFNWFTHYRTTIKIHYFVTFNVLFALGFQNAKYFEIRKLAIRDSAPLETSCTILFQNLAQGALFITLLLGAKGWCIYKSKLTFNDVFLSVLYVSLIIVFNSLLSFANALRMDIIFSIIAIISLALFLRELIISINRSKLHFIAHIYVIFKAGINSKTTPIYAKYKVYTILKKIIIGSLIFVILDTCINVFANPFYWIESFLMNLFQLTCTVLLSVLFRLKKDQSEDLFLDIYNEDNEFYDDSAPEEICVSDLENIDLKELDMKSKRKWVEGVKLPRPPKIIKNKKGNNIDVFQVHLLDGVENGENVDAEEEDLERTMRSGYQYEFEDLG